ncbi:hypothetical protein WDU94_007775 [Cyamophila willieti]
MLLKMIYQIEYIQHGEWNVTCTNSTPGPNKTYNSAEWLGFYKVSDSNTLAHLLSGYIAVIMVVTLNTVVCTRQKYKRHLKGRSLARPYIMFPRVSYKEVDKDIIHCVKYLFNYAFYRFGVEVGVQLSISFTASSICIYRFGVEVVSISFTASSICSTMRSIDSESR